MSSVSLASVGVVAIVLTAGITSQTVNDRTLEDCEIDFVATVDSPVFSPAPAPVFTSCGYVYVAQHSKNGIFSVAEVDKMKSTIFDNDTVDIKATGWPIAIAYEVTPAE